MQLGRGVLLTLFLTTNEHDLFVDLCHVGMSHLITCTDKDLSVLQFILGTTTLGQSH